MSVSLVTYNGLRWLPGCLDSLAEQTLAEFELLVLDNASHDGTTEWLRDRSAQDRQLDLVVANTNVGYAAGHNRNIARSRGEVVVLLNQDTELHPDYLSAVVETFQRKPTIGAVQARVSRLSGPARRVPFIDTTGLQMHRDRRVISRDQGRPEDLASRPPGSVWGVDGPVAAYRRAALDDARIPRSDGAGNEVLDEDFFMYKEDVDLAWRLRLLGWSTAFEPRAIAWHARTASGPSGTGWRDIARRNRATPPWIRELSWRNQRLMQLKNERLNNVLRDLPWILRREILSLAYIVLADTRRLSAVAALGRAAPTALAKRKTLWARIASNERRPRMPGDASAANTPSAD